MSNLWGPPYVVDGPRPVAPRWTLIAQATVIDDPDPHWQNGAQVYAYLCEGAENFNPCSTGTERVKALAGIAPIPEFGSFGVYLGESCTPRSFGSDWRTWRDRIGVAFMAVESQAVERELSQGTTVPVNPYFGDANLDILNGGAATAPELALGLLEDAIGDTGKQGMIHASPAVATALAASHLLTERSGRLETWLGTTVVVGDGYIGADPVSGDSPVEGSTGWLFATGPVTVRRSGLIILPEDIREAMDRENNLVTFYAERYYLADWDTCVQAGVLVNLVDAGGGGGGGDASAANQLTEIARLNSILAELQGTLDTQVVAALPAGNNNIGDVDVASLPALPAGTNNIGDVDVLTLPAIPAGNNNIGDVDIASLPNEGQQTMANSISVAVASDQSNLPTKEQRSGTATVTTVADNAASTQLLASNANRLGATVENDSSATLYVKCGTTASTTDYTVQIPQNGYWECPANYTGRIDGIWATDPGNGAARITEFT